MPSFFWTRDESPARRMALAPLLLAEGPYRAGAWLHRRFYEWTGRRARLPALVVSIGNLTVGGSAKTPLVAWLARELSADGRKVAVLSRGVGGRRAHRTNVVSDGERVLLGAAEAGDEPVLLAGAAPGVPVLSGRNRVALGLRAAALFGPEILLLDDGFQHHRVARDLELVLVEAGARFGNGHVLPRGPLREPPGALSRADALVFTRAPEGFDPAAARDPALAALRAATPRFAVALEPLPLRRHGSVSETLALAELRGRSVGLLAALARPDRVVEDLERGGARVAARRLFPDHHLYRRRDLEGLAAELLWVTTAKDAVKIPESWLAGQALFVLDERIAGPGAGALASWVLERLDELPRS